MCKVSFVRCTTIIDMLIWTRIRTIHLPALRCSSRSQPVWIVTRLLQESDTSNTHTCTMGPKRQCSSPRTSLILYHLARLVRHCARRSGRNCAGHISKSSIYKNQRNLRVRTFREHCCQFSSVRCFTHGETLVGRLIKLAGQGWSNTILPY